MLQRGLKDRPHPPGLMALPRGQTNWQHQPLSGSCPKCSPDGRGKPQWGVEEAHTQELVPLTDSAEAFWVRPSSFQPWATSSYLLHLIES